MTMMLATDDSDAGFFKMWETNHVATFSWIPTVSHASRNIFRMTNIELRSIPSKSAFFNWSISLLANLTTLDAISKF